MTATTTKERPIIFSAPMIRAILDGRKTQTRRVVNQIRSGDEWVVIPSMDNVPMCPYGQVGDLLWVREVWAAETDPIIYRADCSEWMSSALSWRSPIHMPRSACRLRLEITDVRAERLQEITGKDVAAEGFPFSSDLDQYKLLWNDLNASRGYSWESNPYVWVLTFKRIEET